MKVFGITAPPKRPNTLPPRLKFPPQAVKKLKVYESNQNLPSNAKWQSRGGNLKVYTTQSHGPFSAHIVINDWERDLCNGSQPSRQRHLPAILATTAAGAQRSGATRPSFLPRGLTPGQALAVSRNIDPFRRALDLASSPKDKRNFQRIDDVPKVAKSNRHRVIRELAALEAKLKPLRAKLQGKLNPLAPARSLHIPIIKFLVRKPGYPDKTLASDLTMGVEITGTIEPSHALSPRKSPATKQFAPLRDGLRARNTRILRPLKGANGPLLRTK